MEKKYLLAKGFRRVSLHCCLPILREKFLYRTFSPARDFAVPDIPFLRDTLTQSISGNALDRLRSRGHSISQGYSFIFSENPILRSPGVFTRHPRTGRAEKMCLWPHAKISNSAGDEDIKFLWELNRLGDLDCLTAMAVLDKDPAYCESGAELISLWDRDNPAGRGPNWFSNMEVALRLLRLLFFHGVSRQLGGPVNRAVEMIHEHYTHVKADWKTTRRTMKGGNHLIVELAALTAYEMLFKTQGNAASELRKECVRQFLEDGGYFEGSLGYHIFVLNVLLFVHWILKAAKVKTVIPEKVLEKGVYFLAKHTAPNGSVPAIGDWDDGFVFKPAADMPGDVRFHLEFGRKIIGLGSAAGFGAPSIHWAKDSGVVMRSYDDGLFLFRVAPVVHGHAHLDLLSLHYIEKDGPIILDGGTFQYNCSKTERSFFRSLAAHSTIVPSSSDWPVLPMGTFAWKGNVFPQLKVHENTAYGAYEFVGIGKVARKVVFEKSGVGVFDRWAGNGFATSQFLVPGIIREDGAFILLGEDGRKAMKLITRGKEPKSVRIDAVNVSKSYGKKEKVLAVKFQFETAVEFEISFL